NMCKLATKSILFPYTTLFRSLHEAAGEGLGHSSAAQAGEIATEAGAQKLVLVHYNVWEADPSKLVPEARKTFNGPVELAVDYTVDRKSTRLNSSHVKISYAVF